MPAAIFDDEDSPPIDPDDLKMPESPQHRQVSDLIGLAAARLLGPGHEVFRDMNWYPGDGGPAMAPDVMVLPAGAWVAPPGSASDEPLKSYRQDLTGGPPPIVVVEVPSASDGFLSLQAKIGRCQQLGAVVYLVSPSGSGAVQRLEVVDQTGGRSVDPETWIDRPIPELGGLRLRFEGDDLVAVLPDGTRAASDVDLLAKLDRRADQAVHRAVEAERRAVQAEHRAVQAERRATTLAQRLTDLGVEPEE